MERIEKQKANGNNFAKMFCKIFTIPYAVNFFYPNAKLEPMQDN